MSLRFWPVGESTSMAAFSDLDLRCHSGSCHVENSEIRKRSLEISGLVRNFGCERSWNCSFKSGSCPGQQPHPGVTEVYKLFALPCFRVWLTPPLQNESLRILSQPQYL